MTADCFITVEEASFAFLPFSVQFYWCVEEAFQCIFVYICPSINANVTSLELSVFEVKSLIQSLKHFSTIKL